MLSQNVDWYEIEFLVKKLSNKISKLPRTFSSITTLSRGGLVPARLVADHLGIKKIFVDKKKISSDSLFVDDIFDSGDTFDEIIKRVDVPSKFVYATLFARRGKKYPKQLLYGKKTNNNAYVVFPWDKLEFERSQK
ncbi:Xanthine phosphoribosyltransferase protein [Marine Group I thaumarchaeote SCGC AAA799-E16]|uniref:Xanthine phosphoribosyltransferase protein n=6 Tax=Marine Group I TaxID=905826 RepID=A0A087S7D1_9ARCH|nr:Xanthine phosphoribosyltransferase protein [Marine Group I thaumarchaeote SCGC AAA799-N04]KER05923.1 Xanthine phosphoribosyltransferase protein [Marine Group I thaumarchaeote SCGC AAA799-E16]KFM16026.1 Xanthine phosphoribosyltransferase protein [Marine Group I thaumarchaeote SCGC AAA799-D11]KFM17763.1 Xanthine phosphoribosyltransferase protein [Marine Group I thaumarchaeote SCGC RSA3]KFM18890.1 Xanthine phosphoribosyltransferase protein [Marine Group I thaumarchaeote SCGC AAA799-P11]KFM2163